MNTNISPYRHALHMRKSPFALRLTQLRNSKGFTLMELLVVVAILAIVAGLVTVAYDGLVGQAAKGTSANAISSLSNAISVYQVTERKLPSNLDTLLATTPTTSSWDSNNQDNVATSYSGSSSFIASLHPLLASKLTISPLTAAEKTNLVNSGIASLRYIDSIGNNPLAISSTSLLIQALDRSTFPPVPVVAQIGSINLVDIPAHIFDVPTPNLNRGRGFMLNLAASTVTTPHVAILNPVEYPKLGVMHTTARLAVFGVGKNSSIVQVSDMVTGTATKARLSSAPFYGDVGKAEYPNYLMVVDVSQSPARFITVIDPTGGFLAENYAAGRGQ